LTVVITICVIQSCRCKRFHVVSITARVHNNMYTKRRLLLFYNRRRAVVSCRPEWFFISVLWRFIARSHIVYYNNRTRAIIEHRDRRRNIVAFGCMKYCKCSYIASIYHYFPQFFFPSHVDKDSSPSRNINNVICCIVMPVYLHINRSETRKSQFL